MPETAPEPRTAAEYEAAFELLMAEANAIHAQMDRTHAETERLKVETDTLRAESDARRAKIDAEHEAARTEREQQYNWEMAKREREYEALLQEHARLLAERKLPPGTRLL